MRPRRSKLTAIAILSALTFAPAVPAAAQRDTLAGKSVQMIIGFGPGGGYDLWGRTIAAKY
jgi:tripartite-type tricarboxylate transporter receptor subunit TctC